MDFDKIGIAVNQFDVNQFLPYAAWVIALMELILGLYVLVLNAWHTANRHASLLLLVAAINSFAIGSLYAANNVGDAQLPAMVFSSTVIAVEPMLLTTAIALFKPAWLSGKKSWLWWPIYALAIIPTALTLSDRFFHTNLWYPGSNLEDYFGGIQNLPGFTQGRLSPYLRLIGYGLAVYITPVLLLVLALFDRKAAKGNRKLAWMLLFTTSAAVLLRAYAPEPMHPKFLALIPNLILALSYGIASYVQMLFERRAQRGSLQVRLTALILTVSVPLIIFITLFVVNRAETILKHYALQQLQDNRQFLSTRIIAWQERHLDIIRALVKQPELVRMNSRQQKRLLEIFSLAYPDLSLVSILDLDGDNIYRSDGAPFRNYSQRSWFQSARSGKPITMEAYLDGVSSQPILVLSAPVQDDTGVIVGVGMISTSLDALDKLLQEHSLGRQARVMILDERDRIIALSNLNHNLRFLTPESSLIRQLKAQTEVNSASKEDAAIPGIDFLNRDDAEKPWYISATTLENGWKIVVQIPEATLLANLRIFRIASWLVASIGAALLLVLSWLTIRQAIRPIRELTSTATSIANGDLTQVAIVDAEDEIGKLARAFNSMTGQLRELVANLEHRVADRTRDLERRAVQLHAAAEVSREAASIRDLEQLLDHTVQLISTRFHFYHAGLFLIDQSGKNAVLRAASSEGGQRMLARNHMLPVGKEGIVGYVAETGKPRIAHDMGSEAGLFNNPDLPQTRSELALPLKARDQVIGVLDVQSTKPGAFSEDDLTTLQIMADQIALAIDNTRLLTEMQQTLQELRHLYELQVGQSWQKRLANRKIAFQYDHFGTRQINPMDWEQTHQPDDSHTIRIPIVFRGHSLGTVSLSKGQTAPPWSQEEIELLNAIMTQFSLALENARLLEETQRRAERERQVAEISARIRSSTDPEEILKTAAMELLQALSAQQTQVWINPELSETPAAVKGGNGRHPSQEGDIPQE